jgi:hypothetical protein
MATIVEIDCTTGISVEREQTPEEMAASQKMFNELEAKRAADEQAQATQAASLASAQAKLTSLGLTAEEVAAITGQPITQPAS